MKKLLLLFIALFCTTFLSCGKNECVKPDPEKEKATKTFKDRLRMKIVRKNTY